MKSYEIGGNTITTMFSTNLLRDFPRWMASTGVNGGIVGFSVKGSVQSRRSAMLFGKVDPPFPVDLIQLAIGMQCLVAKICTHTRCTDMDCFPKEIRNFLTNPGFTFCGMSAEEDMAWLRNHYRISGRSICLDLAAAAAEQQSTPAAASLPYLVRKLLLVEAYWPVVGDNWSGITGNPTQKEYVTMEAYFSSAIGDLLMA